jgi:aminodeoxychorismate lyase
MSFIYLNGNFYPDTEAKISARDRSFRFGDGIFETISFYEGKLYRWDLHSKRLEGGLEALKITFNTERLEGDILKTIEKNNLTTGLARVTISRGEGSRGYLPTDGITANYVIEAMPRPPMDRESAKLCVSSYKKIPAACLPVNFKLNQGLNSTLAKMDARTKDCFDALQLTINNHVAECASGNIFWVKADKAYTPSLGCDILNGVMRQVVLELLPQAIQGKFSLDELKTADEIFITNVAWRILPVSEIENIFKNTKGFNFTKELRAKII